MHTQISPLPAAPAHDPAGDAAGLQRLLLRQEVEEFLYREADLIDSRRFDDWLDTLADDLSYFMPIRRNVKYGTHDERENTRQGRDISWFDEGKETISKRVRQIRTYQHWAEEPPSRTTRYLTNLRILDSGSGTDAALVRTRCNFMVNRNRNESDDHFLCGHRIDLLTRHQDTWRIKERKIYINQSTILMGNLSFIV